MPGINQIVARWNRIEVRPKPMLGWIGCDIGTQAIKLAQVERAADGFCVVGKWLIPLESPAPFDAESGLQKSLDSFTKEFRQLRSLFQGRQAAVCLSMSMTKLRSLDVPQGTTAEVRQMVGEDLADEYGDSEYCFACWESGDSRKPNVETLQQTALSIKNEIACMVAQTMNANRLECQVLDGLPCALARATEMALGDITGERSVALDIGFGWPTLVQVFNGRPCFTRQLRDCGLSQFVRPIQECFGLSSSESLQLLTSIGFQFPGPQFNSNTPAGRIFQLISTPLNALVNEVKRTLQYLEKQAGLTSIKCVHLFGGGAAIPNLAEFLASELELEVSPWNSQLRNAPASSPKNAAFGTAIALSKLAWEVETCL